MKKIFSCVMMMLAAVTAAMAAEVSVTRCEGWIETASIQWTAIEGAARYGVSYEGEGVSGTADDMLIRSYDGYVRCDIPGLKAGSYSLTVTAYGENGEVIAQSGARSAQTIAMKREGYAFTEGTVPGGYDLDGTPKAGARIIYVTANTANTVKCEVSADGKSSATYEGIASILQAYGKGRDKTPLIIRVVGTVRDSDIAGLKDGNYLNFEGSNANDRTIGDITIEGIGSDAALYGYGICFKRTKGIEVRNLAIMLFGDDAISMDTDNYHNFIHHCDFFYGKPGADADQVKGDGSIDMKYRSTLTTIAYNHFFDSGKVMGCGGATKEETNLLITFHHNWFDHCDSRCPRLNHTTAHIYNNYYDGVSVYGIGCTEVSNACIESNCFRGVKRPMMIAGQGTDYVYASDKNKGTFSSQPGGMSKAYNNKVENVEGLKLMYQTDDAQEFDAWLVASRGDRVPETVSAKKGGHVYDNFDTAEGFYTSVLDDPDEVADIVTTYAGRMDGGDIKWTFDNSIDDENHDINTELKAAITSYVTGIVAIQGDGEAPGDGGDDGDGSDPGQEPAAGGVTAGGYIVDLIADTNSGFSVAGSTSNSKGTVTVGGTTYNTCLKMGSSSSVTFSVSEPMVMTLYFAASENKRISVTSLGEKTIPSTNIVTGTLSEAGTYTIVRTSGESYLYYIALAPVATAVAEVRTDTSADSGCYNLAGQRVSSGYRGLVIKNGSKIVF